MSPIITGDKRSPRPFGPSITRNLITRVLTICHVKLTQSTALEQKRFDPARADKGWAVKRARPSKKV